ncbi:DDB1- and CUL4-associated factor 17 isoform X2 [Symphalangus syndactylus]|uniref:DDB1- and CUL4-associated factor 17 isoform X2 n=1 Tax=Symphalangus syndactylus TaxID=9590 RepID=UPI002443248E|nr:DDB1- and CUL4-associated factor 17 isoform X2 [Symphalangus syndactylus]
MESQHLPNTKAPFTVPLSQRAAEEKAAGRTFSTGRCFGGLALDTAPLLAPGQNLPGRRSGAEKLVSTGALREGSVSAGRTHGAETRRRQRRAPRALPSSPLAAQRGAPARQRSLRGPRRGRASPGSVPPDGNCSSWEKPGCLTRHWELHFPESTKFKNVWTTHSRSPIAYERGRIYFDNYRRCVSSVASEPRKLYEMPKCSKSEKIEDALLWECPVGDILPNSSDYKSSLIALTAHNWLLRISATTGKILEKIYLAPYCKFRYLSWDTPQEVIAVKSAQNRSSAVARQAGIQQHVLLYLAVFRVLPFSLVGILEINKKIFGNVTDATLSHGILIVMYSSGLVRLYSFQTIAEQFMQQKLDLGCACRWGGTTGTVGEAPFGIPCNIKITDMPPLLFEVSSLENAFQIGGHPWHYIITPNKKKQKGVFHICALKDNSLAKNGIQEMDCCSLESDWIYFHPDASGRIIHVGPNQVKVLKLTEIENNSSQHQISEDFVILANRENNKNENVLTVTASGRVVKKSFNLLDDDPEQETFKIVDYEDELDLLSVVAVTQIDAEGKAHLDFHCNEYGTLLKSIPLVESWDVTYSHEVYFDRDLVLHIEQKPNRVFSCYVYQMVCDTGEEEETINRSC